MLKETGQRELYELAHDPGEASPRAPAPEQVARIETALAAWIEEHATDLYGDRSRVVPPEELSPETVEKLRTLGYVE